MFQLGLLHMRPYLSVSLSHTYKPNGENCLITGFILVCTGLSLVSVRLFISLKVKPVPKLVPSDLSNVGRTPHGPSKTALIVMDKGALLVSKVYH